MKVRVLGCGEAFDSGPGNNSYLLQIPKRRGEAAANILIDCGYQMPERLWAEGLDRTIDAIYLTHTHADHAFGVVPLLTRYWEDRRKRPLTFIGHRGIESYTKKAMNLGYPGMWERLRFPIEFLVVSPAAALTWRGVTIRTAKSRHGVTNLSARFETAGKSCAFSGDGAITPETEALYDGVDVLFHELFAARRDIPGHTNLVALKAMAGRIPVGKIVASHHSRRYKTGVVRALARLATEKSGPTWCGAEPGMNITV